MVLFRHGWSSPGETSRYAVCMWRFLTVNLPLDKEPSTAAQQCPVQSLERSSFFSLSYAFYVHCLEIISQHIFIQSGSCISLRSLLGALQGLSVLFQHIRKGSKSSLISCILTEIYVFQHNTMYLGCISAENLHKQ